MGNYGLSVPDLNYTLRAQDMFERDLKRTEMVTDASKAVTICTNQTASVWRVLTGELAGNSEVDARTQTHANCKFWRGSKYLKMVQLVTSHLQQSLVFFLAAGALLRWTFGSWVGLRQFQSYWGHWVECVCHFHVSLISINSDFAQVNARGINNFICQSEDFGVTTIGHVPNHTKPNKYPGRLLSYWGHHCVLQPWQHSFSHGLWGLSWMCLGCLPGDVLEGETPRVSAGFPIFLWSSHWVAWSFCIFCFDSTCEPGRNGQVQFHPQRPWSEQLREKLL